MGDAPVSSLPLEIMPKWAFWWHLFSHI